MKPSLKIWFSLLDRQISQLKKIGGLNDGTAAGQVRASGVVYTNAETITTQPTENPTPQIRLVLENLLTHIKLGWALFQENTQVTETIAQAPLTSTAAMDKAVEDVLAKARQDDEVSKAQAERALRISQEIERLRDPTFDEDAKPWWAKKTKFVHFATFACEIIRKAAKKHLLVAMQPTDSLDNHFQAFLQLTPDLTVIAKGRRGKLFSGPKAVENFTLAVAERLKVYTVALNKRHGGLSYLLADLEERCLPAPKCAGNAHLG